MRVELNGKWAELTDKPLEWGDRNKLRSAASRDFWVDFAPALVTWATESWSEPGDPKDVASWEPVDPEFGDAVFGAALNIWKVKAEEAKTNPTVEQSAS